MMYNGQDIIHTTASANLSVSTGWLILSITLGSFLTFTFFAAISTSFYCCQKPIQKDDTDTQSLIDQGNPAQKLFFPNVPSTVYPTTQSILQQEDNEVIDSLTPAYRELPSTHFSYISSFNGSITTDPTSSFGNQQNTVYPNSTKNSILPHTSSDQLSTYTITTDVSSEQPSRRKDRKSNSKINHIDDSNIFIHTTSPPNDPITLQAPSTSHHHTTNDSSLSIHITNAPVDPQMCMTSATSGIITEEDLAVEADDEYPGRILEPAMNRLARNDQRRNESAMNDVQLNKPATNDQRLCAKAIENTSSLSDHKSNYTEYTVDDSSRGASSFGSGLELSPKTRVFTPDYYALTFRREGSGLSDISCSSSRGASVFANDCQRGKPIMVSPDCVTDVRGASVFEKTSEVQKSQLDTTYPTEETENLQTGSFSFTKESSTSYNAADSEDISKQIRSASTLIRNSAHSEVGHAISPNRAPKNKPFHENILFQQETRKRPNTRGSSQTIAKSVHGRENENNSSILILRNVKSERKGKSIPEVQNKQDIVTSSSESAVATETRPNSRFIQCLSKASIDKSKLVSGYKPSDLKSELNFSERVSNRRSIVLTNNHSITSNLHGPRTYEKSSDYSAPVKLFQDVSSHSIDPMMEGNDSVLKSVNSSCQSLRGASQLGCLADEVDGVCSDSDACWPCWDSVSLSFAYESATDEDVVSQN